MAYNANAAARQIPKAMMITVIRARSLVALVNLSPIMPIR